MVHVLHVTIIGWRGCGDAEFWFPPEKGTFAGTASGLWGAQAGFALPPMPVVGVMVMGHHLMARPEDLAGKDLADHEGVSKPQTAS